MISVILNKNNKDEFSFARITINGSIMTLDYADYQKLVAAMESPEIFNYRGEKLNK